MIFRNGTRQKDNNDPFKPIVENINRDPSSIYMTSTQNIPIIASSDNYDSYSKEEAPINPTSFYGPQILLRSGRLVLNTYFDHILLSSAKSINLNAVNSVNMDTDKLVVNAKKICLGIETLSTEPLLLGNITAELLRQLIQVTKRLTNALGSLESDPIVNLNTPATFANANLLPISSELRTILDGLEAQVGTSSDTCLLTSKRYFTSI